MIARSKAPLRIGLAGGGTDVSPYCDLYGGAILNATISMYSYASLEPRSDGKIVLDARDRNERYEYAVAKRLEIDGKLDLAKGIYNRMMREFCEEPFGFTLTTYSDAPPGSGLGTSSTMMVAILGVFMEYLKLPFGEYDIAHLAYEIERVDLAMAGGRQDQYAATFGGVNFMEFFQDDKVIVNPLRVRSKFLHELAHNLILYYTETSRESAKIISSQAKNVSENKQSSIEAMDNLKVQATQMKESLLKGELDRIGQILDFGWQNKKAMAAGISNPLIDDIYQSAISAGATGGKISGAGGGGFMIFYAPGTKRFDVIEALKKFGGRPMRYQFTNTGLTTWTI